MTDTVRSPRYLPSEWTLPLLTDENTQFFTSGQLLLQKCAPCGSVQHPPEEICRECQAMEFDYVAARPTGLVESFTVVHHAVHPLLKTVVPYNVVVVALDEYPDVHIVGNVIDLGPGDLEIGIPVRATWAEVPPTDEQPETMYLLQWSDAR